MKNKKELKSQIWQPEIGEVYWFVTATCRSVKAIFRNDDVDIGLLECGNFFKTEAEAEWQVNILKYTSFFCKYVEERTKPLDWENLREDKWYAYYSSYDEMIYFYTENHRQLQGVIYASSRKILEDAINFIGEENFLKYVIGVKNEK